MKVDNDTNLGDYVTRFL